MLFFEADRDRKAEGLLFLQLNNARDFPRDSLSVVLRGYLIETLIRQRMEKFTIWAGTGPAFVQIRHGHTHRRNPP
jgi:hypothetical protein